MSAHTLSKREQACLEHLQRAEEFGVSLAEYAAAYGVKVKDLYNGKRHLTQKGVLGSQPAADGNFVPVQVAAEPSSVYPCNDAVIRLRHSSGWVLECADWPSAEWLSLLLASSGQVSS
ncbi:MAG: hypothetical protein ACNA7T_05640 [Haliea sp.]